MYARSSETCNRLTFQEAFIGSCVGLTCERLRLGPLPKQVVVCMFHLLHVLC